MRKKAIILGLSSLLVLNLVSCANSSENSNSGQASNASSRTAISNSSEHSESRNSYEIFDYSGQPAGFTVDMTDEEYSELIEGLISVYGENLDSKGEYKPTFHAPYTGAHSAISEDAVIYPMSFAYDDGAGDTIIGIDLDGTGRNPLINRITAQSVVLIPDYSPTGVLTTAIADGVFSTSDYNDSKSLSDDTLEHWIDRGLLTLIKVLSERLPRLQKI